MPNKTTNFNLDLPVGDDLFNPLWPNSNTNKIDAQMKKNMDNSVTKADCVFNTNKFIITREDKTGKIFKFIAPNDYVAGYTFTVDGTAMDGIVAGTGDALADGCFMNGHEVIAYIDETTASLAFLVGSSLPDAIDATTLGGHAVDYFATAEGLTATNQIATSAGTLANQALSRSILMAVLWNNATPNVAQTEETVTLSITREVFSRLLTVFCDCRETANNENVFGVELAQISSLKWGGNLVTTVPVANSASTRRITLESTSDTECTLTISAGFLGATQNNNVSILRQLRGLYRQA